MNTTTKEKQPIVYGMEALTIEIILRSDGEYDYRVWPRDVEGVAELEAEGLDEGSDNGGVCTGNMGDAVGMAADAALAVVRAHFSDNVFNNDICPSSLDENGEPNVYNDGEAETDHKPDEDTGICDECGAQTRDEAACVYDHDHTAGDCITHN